MKKNNLLLGVVVLATTALIGVRNVVVVAAEEVQPNPANAETPITAELTLNQNPGKPTPPNAPGEGGGDKETNINGLFGIAYVPNTLSGTGQLNTQGQQEISLANNRATKYNVGVQDKTRKKDHSWKLTAKLQWIGDTNGYMAGTTITATGGKVQENKNGTLHGLNGNPVTTSASNLTIDQSGVEIMKSTSGQTMNGVYNYQFDNPQLVIPDVSKVPAGTYSGNINWDLANTPVLF